MNSTDIKEMNFRFKIVLSLGMLSLNDKMKLRFENFVTKYTHAFLC